MPWKIVVQVRVSERSKSSEEELTEPKGAELPVLILALTEDLLITFVQFSHVENGRKVALDICPLRGNQHVLDPSCLLCPSSGRICEEKFASPKLDRKVVCSLLHKAVCS